MLLSTLTGDDHEPVFYSLLIDESNDRGVEAKDLVVLVRFFDPRGMKAVTRFIGLPTANNGTARAIFNKVDECLEANRLKYANMLAFNSDTCNTMKGQRNGVVKHLKEKQPNLLDFGCICHLENLAVKAAMKTLPTDIDALLVDINTFFYLSVKRKGEFKSFCEFVNIGYKSILSRSVRVTARDASAHAMLQKMVGSRHYAVRVPIPSDFGIGTVSCVHVYMCSRSLSLYVRGPLSCTAPCGFRALTYAG